MSFNWEVYLKIAEEFMNAQRGKKEDEKIVEKRVKNFSLEFNAPKLFEFEGTKDDNNSETTYNT